MSFRIRKAEIEDLQDISTIFRKCWTDSYKDILPLEVREGMSDSAARDLWSGSLGDSNERVTCIIDLLIDEHWIPAGVARFGKDASNESMGHLFSLYIAPEFSGKKLGQKLLTYVLDTLHSQGFSSISLWVFKSNMIAQSLYAKFGFKFTGTERIDARWKIPEIEMLSTFVES